MSTMTLLDPRFKYVPALATDVASTWRRFGFDPQDNERRRAKQQLPALSCAPLPGAAIQDLLLRVAAPRLVA